MISGTVCHYAKSDVFAWVCLWVCEFGSLLCVCL